MWRGGGEAAVSPFFASRRTCQSQALATIFSEVPGKLQPRGAIHEQRPQYPRQHSHRQCAASLRPVRPREDEPAGNDPACRHSRPGHDRDPRSGKRVSRAAGRHDDRRHLSGGHHRHGRAAAVQGFDPRGEHRPNRRLDRRVDRRRGRLHDSRVRHRRLLERVSRRPWHGPSRAP